MTRCDSCHLTHKVLSWAKELCNLTVAFIALIGSLASELPIATAEKSTLKKLLLLGQRLVIHLFLGCEPRLHSTLPHTSYKDIVSACGATQWWVLQKCFLICLCFEVSSSVFLERKATEIKSQFKLFLIGDFFFNVVLITKPCQIASYLTLYCSQYCLYSSTHKQHDLVYHSRFTCFRHCWSFHWWLHMTVIHLQMGD